nr:hypothetical protein [Tanacetum cinerariifolium]
ELAKYINTPSWNRPAFYNYDDDDDDEDYSIAITPVLSTEEPVDSLLMKDEHLDTIPATKLDEVIKSNDSTSSDDDSFEDIDYVEASPLDSEPVNLEESLPEYDSFLFEIEPDQGELTSVVMEENLGEPRVHVPNALPTHPTFHIDSDFIPSDDSLKSDLKVSFPSGTRSKIFDPGIFEVQSKIFLSRDTFYISFIRDPLYPVTETLLPFSFKNENQVFNPGILSSNLLSHRDKITSDFSKNLMMISKGDIPFLDVLFLHFYPP